jgi:peptide-methionine (R)-S-oxide reductase
MARKLKSGLDWRKILTPIQYWVLREKGTEPPFSGKYTLHFEDGIYLCAACSNPLFSSDAKYHSGCGWPAFSKPIGMKNVEFRQDRSFGMIRTEVICSKCKSHLGHVFDDGPLPTGKRFCINSESLKFVKKK